MSVTASETWVHLDGVNRTWSGEHDYEFDSSAPLTADEKTKAHDVWFSNFENASCEMGEDCVSAVEHEWALGRKFAAVIGGVLAGENDESTRFIPFLVSNTGKAVCEDCGAAFCGEYWENYEANGGRFPTIR